MQCSSTSTPHLGCTLISTLCWGPVAPELITAVLMLQSVEWITDTWSMSVTLRWHLVFSYSTNRYTPLMGNITLYTHTGCVCVLNSLTGHHNQTQMGGVDSHVSILQYIMISTWSKASWVRGRTVLQQSSVMSQGDKMLIFAFFICFLTSLFSRLTSSCHWHNCVCVCVLAGPGCIPAYHSLPPLQNIYG